MTEPTTVNVALIVPLVGDLVDLWGSQAINPDLTAIDGFIGGVQTLAVSNTPVTLSVPSGFTATPSAGPTQAQNAVIRVTGALTANVQITLPMPGYMIIENLTTGNFVLSFRAIGSGQVIAVDQGEIQHIYNDGTNVRFVNLGRVGVVDIWAGLSAMPAWVGACTVPPYLLCDGSVYNFSTYPYLGKRLGSAFGGNGITTFGVPDLRGRIPLPYDGTASRITAAGCGLNGQTLGASLDEQNFILLATQVPTLPITGTPNVTPSIAGYSIPIAAAIGNFNASGISGGGALNLPYQSGGGQWSSNSSLSGTLTGTTTNAGGNPHPNVQPSQVTGIAVIRAA